MLIKENTSVVTIHIFIIKHINDILKSIFKKLKLLYDFQKTTQNKYFFVEHFLVDKFCLQKKKNEIHKSLKKKQNKTRLLIFKEVSNRINE